MMNVTFRAEGEEDVRIFAEPGENLLNAARRAGVPLNAPCSGNGSCGQCKVQILSGSLKAPKPYIMSDIDYADGWRLACLARVVGDVVLYIPDL